MNTFQYKNITLGTDPEFFIKDKNGKLISSIGLIEGKKDNPQKIPQLGDGYAIQTDNVLGEFNVPFGYTPHEVANNVTIMKAYISGFLSNMELEPSYMASGVFDDEELDSDEAKLFGCDADFNAWTKDINPKPKGESTNLRSAGMHFHVGYDNNNPKRSMDIIKALDLFLGVPSIIIDRDKNRRQLYGKAGSFRFTPFGVEYRTISGYFLHDDNLIEWAFNQVMRAIEYLNEFGLSFINKDKNNIIKCINNGDVEMAEALLKKYNIVIDYQYEIAINGAM